MKYFNLQKGEVIHHLRDTEEQRNFNDNYYERWGFDFDGQMKYCIKLSIENHKLIHKTRGTTGRKWTDAQRQKIIATRLANGGPWNKGKKMDSSFKLKVSAGLVGKSSWNKGKSWSAEHKQKLREKHIGQKVSDETRQKISNRLKKEYAEGKRIPMKNFSQERNEKISKTLKETWAKKKDLEHNGGE